MRPSMPSPTCRLRLAICLGAALLVPAPAAAESSVAELDAELDAVADPAEVEPGGTSTVRILLRNRGDFGLDDAVVAVRLPATLELVSAEPARGTYDADAGEWTTGELLSFDVIELTLTVQLTGDAAATLTAEVMSIVGSLGAYDRDSTPGNGDPCEDDQTAVTIAITGAPDASVADTPDAGPACPGRPDAGPANDRPDAGIDAAPGPGAGDGGLGADGTGDGGCGCSGTGDGGAAGALALLLVALAAHLPRRRREPRRPAR